MCGLEKYFFRSSLRCRLGLLSDDSPRATRHSTFCVEEERQRGRRRRDSRDAAAQEKKVLVQEVLRAHVRCEQHHGVSTHPRWRLRWGGERRRPVIWADLTFAYKPATPTVIFWNQNCILRERNILWRRIRAIVVLSSFVGMMTLSLVFDFLLPKRRERIIGRSWDLQTACSPEVFESIR